MDLDLCSLTQNNTKVYSFMSQSMGLMADVDLGTTVAVLRIHADCMSRNRTLAVDGQRAVHVRIPAWT